MNINISTPFQRPSLYLFIGIVTLALLVRVVYAWVAPQLDPVLRHDVLHGDASGYHLLAQNLLRGLGLTWNGQTPTSYRMPGYPVFVALIYALTRSENLLSIRFVQALFGALTCIPVFAIAWRLGGVTVAILVGLGIALHPLLIYMTGWLYPETLFILLLWIGLWLLTSTLETARFRQAVLAGLVFGLAILVRPEIASFLPLLLVGSWLLRWTRHLLVTLIIVQMTILLVLLPWMVRNIWIHQAFVPLTTSPGSNFFAGNNPHSEGGSAWTYPIVDLSEVESDRALKQQTLDWIRNHPSDFLALLPKKLFKFLSPVVTETRGSPLGRWALPVNLIYGMFLLIAGWGAWKSWHTKIGAMLLALISCYTLTALIFYGGTRVGLPIAPALMIFAVFGLIYFWSRLNFVRRPSLAKLPE